MSVIVAYKVKGGESYELLIDLEIKNLSNKNKPRRYICPRKNQIFFHVGVDIEKYKSQAEIVFSKKLSPPKR